MADQIIDTTPGKETTEGTLKEGTLKEGVFTVMSVVFSIGLIVGVVAMLLVMARYVITVL